MVDVGCGMWAQETIEKVAGGIFYVQQPLQTLSLGPLQLRRPWRLLPSRRSDEMQETEISLSLGLLWTAYWTILRLAVANGEGGWFYSSLQLIGTGDDTDSQSICLPFLFAGILH